MTKNFASWNNLALHRTCQIMSDHRVAISRSVYYSILESFGLKCFGQRSQYISIKFSLRKHLKKCLGVLLTQMCSCSRLYGNHISNLFKQNNQMAEVLLHIFTHPHGGQRNMKYPITNKKDNRKTWLICLPCPQYDKLALVELYKLIFFR